MAVLLLQFVLKLCRDASEIERNPKFYDSPFHCTIVSACSSHLRYTILFDFIIQTWFDLLIILLSLKFNPVALCDNHYLLAHICENDATLEW